MSFKSFLSFFFAVLSLGSIIVILEYWDNYNVLPPQISKIIQAATATSTSYYLQSCSRDIVANADATITKIQLPGIIPNINGNSSSPTILPPTSTPSVSQSPPPPPIIRNTRAPTAAGGPTLNDPNLKIEQISTGLKLPTSMAFLGPNDILVLEKDTGIVHRMVNGKMLPEPVLQVPVATEGERGLLGIAITKHDNSGSAYVFLYYTQSGGGKTGYDAANSITTTPSGIEPAGNRLYRYNLDERDRSNIKLTHPVLLLNLPASPPPGREGTEKNHNGGKVLIGPDNNVYVGIGDVGGHRGQA